MLLCVCVACWCVRWLLVFCVPFDVCCLVDAVSCVVFAVVPCLVCCLCLS